ncbi:MAG TPA: hypothetical protein PKH91_02665 [Flavobacterium sp.]|nr:hypothetical protein [Flavobacterium sp.]
MGIFNNHEKKVLTELCKKSEDIGNDITNEINELLEDLNTEYEANKVILKEFNTFVSSMENKLNAEELEQLQSFSSKLYKIKRCAKKGVEAMREIARDQKKATRETIREYQEYLYV